MKYFIHILTCPPCLYHYLSHDDRWMEYIGVAVCALSASLLLC